MVFQCACCKKSVHSAGGCGYIPPYLVMNEMDEKATNSEKKNSYDKLDRFVAYLKETQATKFTGYLKINFSQGHIGRVEKFEEILKS